MGYFSVAHLPINSQLQLRSNYASENLRPNSVADTASLSFGYAGQGGVVPVYLPCWVRL